MLGHQICVFRLYYVADTDLAGHCDAQIKQCVPICHNTSFYLGDISIINSESLYAIERTMALTVVPQRHRQPACIVHVWQVGLLPGAALTVGCGAQHMPFLHPHAHL